MSKIFDLFASVVMLATILIPWFMVCVYYNFNRFACVVVEKNEWLKETFIKPKVFYPATPEGADIYCLFEMTHFLEFKDLNIFYARKMNEFLKLCQSVHTLDDLIKVSRMVDTTVVKFRKVTYYVLWFWTVIATSISGGFVYIEFIR